MRPYIAYIAGVSFDGSSFTSPMTVGPSVVLSVCANAYCNPVVQKCIQYSHLQLDDAEDSTIGEVLKKLAAIDGSSSQLLQVGGPVAQCMNASSSKGACHLDRLLYLASPSRTRPRIRTRIL